MLIIQLQDKTVAAIHMVQVIQRYQMESFNPLKCSGVS